MSDFVNVVFDGVKSFDDWGIKLETIQLSFPEPKTDMINIPGMEGMLDLTEVNGPVCYKNRTLTLKFSAIGDYTDWHSLSSKIAKEIHGKVKKCILPDDPEYYYEGRFELKASKDNDVMEDVIISGDVGPYKMDVLSSEDKWIWDPFSFLDGVIKEYSDIVISGSRDVVVIGSDRLTVPRITASSNMTVEFEGATYQLYTGENIEYDIVIKNGENHFVFAGNGTVTISYRGGIL